MNPKRRVLVTGLGCVSPINHGVKTAFSSVKARLADKKAMKTMDRRSQLALAAAFLAIDSANLVCAEKSFRRGISLGVGFADPGEEEHSQALHHADRNDMAAALLKNLHPLWLLKRLPNIPASHLAIQFKAAGPSSTTSCGRQALQYAVDCIRSGTADCMLCGAADSSIFYPAEKSIPLDPTLHRHASICEASAILILESEDHAAGRQAHMLAEFIPDDHSTPPHGFLDPYVKWEQLCGNPLSAVPAMACALAVKKLSEKSDLSSPPHIQCAWLPASPIFDEPATTSI